MAPIWSMSEIAIAVFFLSRGMPPDKTAALIFWHTARVRSPRSVYNKVLATRQEQVHFGYPDFLDSRTNTYNHDFVDQYLIRQVEHNRLNMFLLYPLIRFDDRIRNMLSRVSALALLPSCSRLISRLKGRPGCGILRRELCSFQIQAFVKGGSPMKSQDLLAGHDRIQAKPGMMICLLCRY